MSHPFGVFGASLKTTVARHGAVSLAAICALLSAGVAVPAYAQVSPPVTETSTTPLSVDVGTMTWGIRSSFNNYTHGPTELIGTATENEKKNRFGFSIKARTYDRENERFEAKFSGGVRYKKYCDREAQDKCQLDLKIENPRIVISPEGSFVYATVTSKQYPSGNVYLNSGVDDSKPIAQLHTANADFKTSGSVVTWSEIPSTLTREGHEMFSHFYPVGVGLDSLTFSFDVSGLEGFARPSTDGAAFAVSTRKFDNEALYERRRELFALKDHVIVATADYRWSPVAKAGFSLLDRDLSEVHSQHVRLNEYGAVAFDDRNQDLYFVGKQNSESRPFNDDFQTVYKVHVDVKTGFGQPVVVHTFADPVTAIGYNHWSDRVLAVTEKQAAVLNSGAVSPTDLPRQSDLVADAGFIEPEGMYGEAQAGFPVKHDLLAMKDGSFILNSGSSSAMKNDKKYFGLMVGIDASAPELSARLFSESASSESGMKTTAARTNGETIVRYNSIGQPEYSFAQTLRYENGQLHRINDVSAGREDVADGEHSDIKVWGNAVLTHSGTLLALDANDGHLKRLNTQTLKREAAEDIAIPKGAKTNEYLHGGMLLLDEGTIFVPSYDDAPGEGEERYVLRKVYDPSFIPPVVDKGQGYEPLEQGTGEGKTPAGEEPMPTGTADAPHKPIPGKPTSGEPMPSESTPSQPTPSGSASGKPPALSDSSGSVSPEDGDNSSTDKSPGDSKTSLWWTFTKWFGIFGGVLALIAILDHFFGNIIRHAFVR